MSWTQNRLNNICDLYDARVPISDFQFAAGIT